MSTSTPAQKKARLKYAKDIKKLTFEFNIKKAEEAQAIQAYSDLAISYKLTNKSLLIALREFAAIHPEEFKAFITAKI